MPQSPQPGATEGAIRHVKSLISTGQLGPGQRLPAERELAAHLGVSRGTMREAIRSLSVMGILGARRGAGVFVTALEPRDLLEGIGNVADMASKSGLLDLLEVRRLLEPQAAALAAARMDEDQVRALELALEAASMDEGDEASIEADMRFHSLLVESARNPTMAAIVEALSTRTFRTRVARLQLEGGAGERTRQEHRRIYEAVRDRDPMRARDAAAAHIGSVEQWVRASLTDSS